MSRNRLYATMLLAGVMVIVIGIIVFVEIITATATTDVYVITHDVQAGTQYTSSTVQVRTLHGTASGTYDFASSPDGSSVFVHGMAVGDIVQQDDLESENDSSQVSVQIKQSPTLNPGDNINIYAADPATFSGDDLIGHNITVVSGNAGSGPITILVPRQDEALWLSISTDPNDIDLYATISPGGSAPPYIGVGPETALTTVAAAFGQAASAVGTATNPTTSGGT